jgi:hypothetical protein
MPNKVRLPGYTAWYGLKEGGYISYAGKYSDIDRHTDPKVIPQALAHLRFEDVYRPPPEDCFEGYFGCRFMCGAIYFASRNYSGLLGCFSECFRQLLICTHRY